MKKFYIKVTRQNGRVEYQGKKNKAKNTNGLFSSDGYSSENAVRETLSTLKKYYPSIKFSVIVKEFADGAVLKKPQYVEPIPELYAVYAFNLNDTLRELRVVHIPDEKNKNVLLEDINSGYVLTWTSARFGYMVRTSLVSKKEYQEPNTDEAEASAIDGAAAIKEELTNASNGILETVQQYRALPQTVCDEIYKNIGINPREFADDLEALNDTEHLFGAPKIGSAAWMKRKQAFSQNAEIVSILIKLQNAM